MFASRRSLSALLALAMLSFIVQPARSQQDQLLCVHGVTAPDYLIVRTAPHGNAPIAGRFPAEACGVQLVGRCEAGWCQMSLQGVSGWAYTKNIAVYEVPRGHPAAAQLPIKPNAEPVEQGSAEPAMCVTGVERGDTLRIRTGPSVRYDEIGGIPPGACDVERAGGCRGPWCKVQWRGRVGWVNSNYLD